MKYLCPDLSFSCGVIHIVRRQKGGGEGQAKCVQLDTQGDGGFKVAYVRKKKFFFLDYKISKVFLFLYKKSYYIAIYYCV